ncbi:MAG: metalloregulator ArsR/SmtB family transcription factor [Puniceicoccaceae bacterium]
MNECMLTEAIYKCFSDRQRLRMLNVLADGPLCVCHVMDILKCPQVQASKQLGYMKRLQVVQSRQQAQWRVYRVAPIAESLIRVNLEHLRSDSPVACELQQDLCKRKAIVERIAQTGDPCPRFVLQPANEAEIDESLSQF